MDFLSHEQLLISQLTNTLKYCDEAQIKGYGIEWLRNILAEPASDTEKFKKLIDWLNKTNQGADVF